MIDLILENIMDLLSVDSRKHIAQIKDNLFVGSFWATKKCILDSLNIKHVISVGADPVGHFKNVSYSYITMDDNTQSVSVLLEKVLPNVLPLIQKCILSNESILVHCSAGKSRSVTIIAAYLIEYCKMTPKEALIYIEEQRACIYPNYGFIEALDIFYEKVQ